MRIKRKILGTQHEEKDGKIDDYFKTIIED